MLHALSFAQNSVWVVGEALEGAVKGTHLQVNFEISSVFLAFLVEDAREDQLQFFLGQRFELAQSLVDLSRVPRAAFVFELLGVVEVMTQ